MIDLYVEYSDNQISYHSEPEQFGEWSEERQFYVKGVQLSKPSRYHYGSLGTPLDVKSGDTVWVLWMIYSTGDSFGCSRGNGEVLWAFKSEEAGKAVLDLLKDSDEDIIKFKDDIGNEVQFSNPSSGYFENQEDVYLEPFTVR